MVKIKNWINENKYILFSVFSFLLFMTFIKPFDSDTYWHIKTGEWILNNGFPQSDPFSYWGGNFIAHEWLFDILIYFVHFIFGYQGLIFLNFLIVGLAFYISMKLAIKKNNKLGILFIFAPLFIIYGAGFLVMRPQLLTMLFFCLEIYLLENKKYIWTLPLIMLLFANIHGGMSILFIIVYLVYFLSDIYNNYENYNKHKILKGMVLLILMVLPMAITPYGLESVMYGSNIPEYAKQTITEYFPLVKSSKEVIILLMVVFPLACMAYTRNAKLVDILMLSMGVISTITWFRMFIIYIPIFIIYGLPYINDTFVDIKNKIFSKFKSKFNILKVFNLCIVFLLLFCIICVSCHLSTSSLDTYEQTNRKMPCSPVIIKEYIEKNNVDIENNVMFNHYNFGGYFIYNDMRVFIDGRNDVYSKEFGSPDIFPDYIKISNADANVLELIKKYNVKYFALYKNDILTNYLISNNLARILIEDTNYIFLEIEK